MYPSTKGNYLSLLGRSTNEPEPEPEEVFLRGERFMQMSFDTGDSCVNKLTVGDLNQLSRAIQGDTQRFELIERFIKVRNLL